MKLQIIRATEAKKPVQKPKTGFESPVGWWDVTTEGDCEGRSVKNLGTYYGHVAEIALHLADKQYYALHFEPNLNQTPPAERATYQATRNHAWVSLGIKSNTWSMDGAERAVWFQKWFDTDDVEVKETDGMAYYYASVFIKLN